MFINIDKSAKMSMIEQIYTSIKSRILSGEIIGDTKLLSSRKLSTELGVSRIIVLEAYEQLQSEGYLYTKDGCGTFVQNIENLAALSNTLTYYNELDLDSNAIQDLRSSSNKGVIDIRTGAPDLSLFPIEKWGSIYKNICVHISKERLDYYNPEGSYQLRVSILKYLNRSRGIVAHPNQILITTGAAQGFTLLSRLLLNKNEHVIVEDPINNDIYRMLLSTGAKILPIPVDEHGIKTELLPKDYNGKLIFTTPSHQFPMGGILSVKRRLELINFAKKSNGFIIEDDYDSSFRFSGNPVSALHTLNSQRVIYAGTFSKTLFPALRIGYVILPPSLTEKFKDLKHLEDLHTPILEQMTLSKFIEQGLLEKHISKCRKMYKRKNETLIKCLKSAFGNNVRILGDSAGIHLVAKINTICFNQKALTKLQSLNLKVSPIAAHTQYQEKYTHHIMIGYGHLSMDEIVKCVDILLEFSKMQTN